jgi:CHASE2 domain-containing sensor protein
MKEAQISAITFFEILFTVLAVVMFMFLGVAPLRTFGLVFATLVFSLTSMIHSAVQIRHGSWTSLAFMIVSLSIFAAAWSFTPQFAG